MTYLACCDIQAVREIRIGFHRLIGALAGELQHERQSRVVQRKGRGARDRAGHIGDAILNNAVNFENRIIMCGRPAGVKASTLIDGNVD